MKTIVFEDHGQDFLEWDINRHGIVVGCRPFQEGVWKGTIVIDQDIHPGDRINIVRKGSPQVLYVKYPVEKIKEAA